MHDIIAYILPWRTAQLEPLPPLGRVHPELSPSRHHWIDSLPMCTWFPTPSLPVDGRALWAWGFSCGLLVLSERGSVELGWHPSSARVRRHKTFADARRSDNPTYQPGDKVWLSTQDLHLRQAVQKAECHYIGPLPVQKSPTYYKLPPRYRIHPSFHVSLLNHSFHLHQDPPSRRHLLLQKWPGMIYSILHCWRNSIISILIVLHPEAMAAPVAAQGR